MAWAVNNGGHGERRPLHEREALPECRQEPQVAPRTASRVLNGFRPASGDEGLKRVLGRSAALTTMLMASPPCPRLMPAVRGSVSDGQEGPPAAPGRTQMGNVAKRSIGRKGRHRACQGRFPATGCGGRCGGTLVGLVSQVCRQSMLDTAPGDYLSKVGLDNIELMYPVETT